MKDEDGDFLSCRLFYMHRRKKLFSIRGLGNYIVILLKRDIVEMGNLVFNRN